MVNPWYLGKEQEIKEVVEKEGFIILFDFLEKEELKILKRRRKSQAKEKEINKVLQGVYAESSFSWHDDFLQKIAGKNIQWKAMEFSQGDYLIRNDRTSLKKGIYTLFSIDDWNDKGGGYAVFIDAEGNHLRVPSTKNTLTLVKNPTSWYVKYVNCLSRGKRRFLWGSTRN